MISWPGGGGGDEEEVMELLWQNGQVVMKSHRPPRKPFSSPDDHHDPSLQQQNDPDNNNDNLFIQEDEMSSWLFSDFCSDLLLPSTPTATSAVPSHLPPTVPPRKRLNSFGHFSRLNRSKAAPADEATVVDSSDTPMVAGASDNTPRAGMKSASAVAGDAPTRVRTATSSSGASSASTEPIPPGKSQEVNTSNTKADASEMRKRKTRDRDRSIDEDVDLLSSHAKRVSRSSSSTKKSRAAEVHNLSERRRRDRINDKMRALQELIPHCNKADKASMLDEAIGYLKYLQMHVQMISSMMYPGMQQSMPHTGIGMNRQMIHFPNVFNGLTPPTTAAGPHMGLGFSFPAFQMPSHIPAPDLSRTLPNYKADAMLSSSSLHSSNSPRMPGLMGPYQQYFGLQQIHLPFQQIPPNTSNSKNPTANKAGGSSRKGSPG